MQFGTFGVAGLDKRVKFLQNVSLDARRVILENLFFVALAEGFVRNLSRSLIEKMTPMTLDLFQLTQFC